MALVEVARFVSLPEAQAAAAALRASGVHVFLQNEHWGQAEPYMQLAMHGFAVWTPEEDAADARAFIEQSRSAAETSPPQGGAVPTLAALGLAVVLGPVIGWLAAGLRHRRRWTDSEG